MTKFEYLVQDIHVGQLVADKLEQQLDGFGQDGWELVSTFDRASGFRSFVFKREKQGFGKVLSLPAA